MVIKTIDRNGQELGKPRTFMLLGESSYAVFPTEFPAAVKFWEQVEAGTCFYGDFSESQTLRLYTWEMVSSAHKLNVIRQPEEDLAATVRRPSEEELLDKWDKYLHKHWHELISLFPGRYVAIWNDAVFDSDEDLAALAERVYAALGYQPIFMPYISEKEQLYGFIPPM